MSSRIPANAVCLSARTLGLARSEVSLGLVWPQVATRKPALGPTGPERRLPFSARPRRASIPIPAKTSRPAPRETDAGTWRLLRFRGRRRLPAAEGSGWHPQSRCYRDGEGGKRRHLEVREQHSHAPSPRLRLEAVTPLPRHFRRLGSGTRRREGPASRGPGQDGPARSESGWGRSQREQEAAWRGRGRTACRRAAMAWPVRSASKRGRSEFARERVLGVARRGVTCRRARRGRRRRRP